MTPIAHASTGYLVSLSFGRPEIIIPTVIGALIPDIDLLFVKNTLYHRDSFLHLPFFWLIILFVASLFISKTIVIGFGLGIFLHIFFDWLTVEERGIGDMRLFYPFSDKKFAFNPEPATGKKYPKNVISIESIKLYMESKFLFLELFFDITGPLVFLTKSNILKLLINLKI